MHNPSNNPNRSLFHENTRRSLSGSQVVWREVKQHFNLRLERKSFVSCSQWLFNFLESRNDLQAAIVDATFWHVLEARNDARNSVEKPTLQRTGVKLFCLYDTDQGEHLLKNPSANSREFKAPRHLLVGPRHPPVCFFSMLMLRSLRLWVRWVLVWLFGIAQDLVLLHVAIRCKVSCLRNILRPLHRNELFAWRKRRATPRSYLSPIASL
jgi:hypothetical protein